MLFAVILFVGYIFLQIDTAVKEAGIPETVPVAESAKEKPISMLLLGLDTREQINSQNTDVIMVASVNPTNKSAVVVSIPRDTYLNLKGYEPYKANAYYSIFARNKKLDAYSEIKKLFGLYLEIPMDYAAIIDFKGFQEMIDVLGGITVNVDINMCYKDPTDGTSIDLLKGRQTLKGKQALDYIRYRTSNCKNTPHSNDLERNARQQEVIAEMLKQIKSIEGIIKLGSLIERIGKNVKTDIPQAQIKDLMLTYMGIQIENVQFIHLSGEWKSPYIYINSEELELAKTALKQQLQ
jgi:LCP family protein required for cell wall assembly